MKKSITLNKLINNSIGEDVLFSYKRASSIINDELKDRKIELSSTTNPILFKTEYENNLYKKVQNLRKYFSSVGREENYFESLKSLSTAKLHVDNFFDNVVVNDDDPIIKKNRLELLKMLCKSFENYFNFSKIET